jgi:hypothetical protein
MDIGEKGGTLDNLLIVFLKITEKSINSYRYQARQGLTGTPTFLSEHDVALIHEPVIQVMGNSFSRESSA